MFLSNSLSAFKVKAFVYFFDLLLMITQGHRLGGVTIVPTTLTTRDFDQYFYINLLHEHLMEPKSEHKKFLRARNPGSRSPHICDDGALYILMELRFCQ